MNINIVSASCILSGLGSIYSGYRSISSSEKSDKSDSRKWAMLKIAVGVAAVFTGAAIALKNQDRNYPAEPLTEEYKRSLLSKFDGYHCRDNSPVYGSRQKELAKLLFHKPVEESLLLGMVGGMENPDGIQHWGCSLVSAKTPAMQKKADVLAQKMFSDYINHYRSSGVTPENAVLWLNKTTDTKLYPGCALGEFILKPRSEDGGRPLGFVRDMYDLGCCYACVPKEIPIGSRAYSPPALVALHELMHVEEICGVIDQNELEKKQGMIETITNLKSVMLADEVNKRIRNIPMDRILRYGHPLRLPQKLSSECIVSFYTKKISKKICPERRIDVGELANFYRDLEKKFATLADALVSRESIDFLTGRQVESLSNKIEL